MDTNVNGYEMPIIVLMINSVKALLQKIRVVKPINIKEKFIIKQIINNFFLMKSLQSALAKILHNSIKTKNIVTASKFKLFTKRNKGTISFIKT